MNCEQARGWMAELLAGEIAPADRRSLEVHLLDCLPCRGDFELARAGWAVEWPDVPGPRADLVARIAAEPLPTRAVVRLRWATSFAASVCLVLLVLVSSRPTARPAPVAASRGERAPFLASMQQAVVGTLFARDEEGRPVGELGLKSHEVRVEIRDGIAKTTVEENFENHTDRRLEGTFHFPLPPDASISRLALEVNGKIEEGTCLERERAREVFESIVRRMQDPALLEWMPGGLFKCRVFPIEPRATKRVIVAYTQALPFFRGKMTYVYPLASEKTRLHPPESLAIDVHARFGGNLVKIESPSHRLDVQRRDGHEALMGFSAKNFRAERDFVLALETSDEELRVVPHKEDGDDGTFALFLTPRGGGERRPAKYVFLLDVSATVTAPELDVARRLVRAMMERGIPGDRFEILAHHVEAMASGEVDLRAANVFMDRLQPIGGCDLLAALRAAPEGEIVYIGEGTPTIGETDPAKILEAVKGRRIRTIGVGSDANVALLEKLGGLFRVSPNDDVPRRVAEIADTLGAPVLSGIQVDGGDAVYDVVGARDCFYGERVVLVGRYRGPAAKLVVTAGDYRRELDVAFPVREEGNNYVRRLWAQRKIAELLAEGGRKEEVTALGVKHQIVTPFTSFLVLETEEMWKQFNLKREVQAQDRVLGERPAASPEEELKRLQEGEKRLKERIVQLETSARGESLREKDRTRERLGVVEDERRRTESELRLTRERDGESVLATELQRRLDEANQRVSRATADQEVLVRQLEVQLAQVQELNGKVEEYRGKLAKSLSQKSTAVAEFQYHRELSERLSRDLAELEGKSVDVGRAWPNRESSGQQPRGTQGRSTVTTSPLTPAPDSGVFTPRPQFEWESESVQRGDGGGLSAETRRPGFLVFDSARIETYTLSAPAQTTLDAYYESLNGRGRGRSWSADPRGDVHSSGFSHLFRSDGGRIELENQKPFLAPSDLRDDWFYQLAAGHAEWRAVVGVAGDVQFTLGEAQGVPVLGDLPVLGGREGRSDAFVKRAVPTLETVTMSGGTLRTGGEVVEVVPPRKALEGKVTAVAVEIGLVLLSIGKADGVLEGDEFTVTRGGEFVARLTIDRAEKTWAAGRITFKKSDPRVADDVKSAAAGPELVGTAGPVGTTVRSAEGNEVEFTPLVRGGLPAGVLLAIVRDSKFVAIVQIYDAAEERPRGRVWRGIAAGRVLPGDGVRVVSDAGRLLAALPAETRLEITSRLGISGVRAKMALWDRQ